MAFDSSQTVAVLGAGSWGSALAILVSEHFQKVILVGRDPEQIAEINAFHTNRNYLPKIKLPTNIEATTDYNEVAEAALILSVLPTSATREGAEALKKVGIKANVPVVSCAKGIERNTGRRMSEIIAELLPENPIAVLSGPNHAEEVSAKMATCAVVGCSDEELAADLQSVFTANYFRTYTSDDIAGIELGGALKNVFAIAAGIVAGIGLGDNAIAALVTRGLTEMTRLGVALGGRQETFSGLSGIGDLMATCYSPHSRNNRVGKALGSGETLEEATDRLGMVAEGVPNTLSIYEAARKVGIETPLIDAVYQVLYEDKPAQEALVELLTREPKPEHVD
ncbi:Glycerol-3-phosphate dehydrogenase [NAD(P)+] [Rubritalea halochordaticola]|uniref:Glycerol-3-phosphate dehydrogenase [NAD(P)+] n=1 Tax=Rubritalea halochordaticola TaxID=714537 RepID=A0ABP9UVA0_9BACT